MKLGTFFTINSLICAEIFSNELDFLIIDREHSTFSLNETRGVLNSISRNCEKYIRVHSCNRIEIQRVLETAPDGIFVPQINSLESAKKAVDFSFYAPKGTRGLSPYTKPFKYSSRDVDSKRISINKSLKLCLLIEGKEGINSLEKILSELGDEIHMIYFGLYDFCSSLGVEADWGNLKVSEELEKIVSLCKGKEINIGTIARTINEIKFLKKQKVEYIVYQNDVAFINERILEIKSNFPSLD